MASVGCVREVVMAGLSWANARNHKTNRRTAVGNLPTVELPSFAPTVKVDFLLQNSIVLQREDCWFTEIHSPFLFGTAQYSTSFAFDVWYSPQTGESAALVGLAAHG
jgi:hypothetical protein